MFRFCFLFVFFIFSTLTTFAADQNPIGNPVISIGGSSMEYSSKMEGPGLVFRVEGVGCLHCYADMVGYLDAEVTVDPTSSGLNIPRFDIHFIPLASGVFTGVSLPYDSGGVITALPIHVSRNTGIGEDLGIKVSLLGLYAQQNYRVDRVPTEPLYIKAMASALGYKFLQSVEERNGKFNGLNVVNLEAEFGVFVSKSHQISVGIGAEADFNLGWQSGQLTEDSLFALQSTYGLFAKVRGHLTRELELYAQAGIRGSANSRLSSKTENYARLGVNYYFRRK